MFVRNNLGKASPTSALVGVQAFGEDELRLTGVTQGSCGPHCALPPSPASLLLLLHLCDCCFCADGCGGEQEPLRRLSRLAQRGGSAHPRCLPCCQLVVSAVLGAELLHPVGVNCHYECLLFLSYVS